MRLDPSTLCLWEKGKRLVPGRRIKSLADALEVSLEELLCLEEEEQRLEEEAQESNTATFKALVEDREAKQASKVQEAVEMHSPQQSEVLIPPTTSNANPPELTQGIRYRSVNWDDEPFEIGYGSYLSIPRSPLVISEPEKAPAATPPVRTWVVAPRPELVGWVPGGWDPSGRVQDISPSLPDGYWLDPVKLERSGAKALLSLRLCQEDRYTIGEETVPGAALAERIYQHCKNEPGYWPERRLPLGETIFRYVLVADDGGLTDSALIKLLNDRQDGIPVSVALLKRLRENVRSYPISRVDADLSSR